MDFTLGKYCSLLRSLQKAGYHFFTFEKYLSEIKEGTPFGNVIILRHDVDKNPENSLSVARIEHQLGIQSSYYFRITNKNNTVGIIKEIAGLGHEIGYHYEDLSLNRGNKEKTWDSFKKQLEYFRQYYPVRTISMHGSPLSLYDNRELWKEFSYKELGINGEPYFDFCQEGDNKYYFTDTGRCWDGERYNIRDKISSVRKHLKVHSTDDLIHYLSKLYKTNKNIQIMITTHPQRWNDNRLKWITEYLVQNFKNKIKFLLNIINKVKGEN